MIMVRQKPDTPRRRGVRRLAIAFAVLLATAVYLADAPQVYRAEARQPPPRDGGQPPPPPVFRGGTTLVQVDAIVSDADGRPIVDLAAADFEALDDGRPVPIQQARFLGAEAYGGDTTRA